MQELTEKLRVEVLRESYNQGIPLAKTELKELFSLEGTLLEIGKISDTEVQSLKDKHGKIFIIEIQGDAPHKFHYAYLKKPSIEVFGRAFSLVEENKVQAAQLVLLNTMEAGDPAIKTDVELFAAAMSPVLRLVPLREGELLQA